MHLGSDLELVFRRQGPAIVPPRILFPRYQTSPDDDGVTVGIEGFVDLTSMDLVICCLGEGLSQLICHCLVGTNGVWAVSHQKMNSCLGHSVSICNSISPVDVAVREV